MLKLIFINLWNRRGRNAWLFLELILVTVISWQLIDSSVVLGYDLQIPMGYDTGRLVKIDFGTLPPSHARYNAEADGDTARIDAVHTILDKLRAFDGVEAATASSNYSYIGNPTLNTAFCPADFSDTIPVKGQFFWTGTDFFRTAGIEAASGFPSEALDNIAPGEMVLTESLAHRFSPDGHIPDGSLKKPFSETQAASVVSVVKDVRSAPDYRSYLLAFIAEPVTPRDKFVCVARVADDVDMAAFVSELRARAPREIFAGNYLVKSVTTYDELFDNMNLMWGSTKSFRRSIVLTVFFMLNLLLGIVGSFYLQTRRRNGEMGVLRAFGATRGRIFGLLAGESFVLATAAVLIGVVLYLQYGLAAGLDYGSESPDDISVADTWINHFGFHFSIISLIVYAVILFFVLLGTYFPAREASRVNPIDALRND